MIIRGWKERYSEILTKFEYDKCKDIKAAILLDSMLKKSNAGVKIQKMINENTVLVIGSGPSLLSAIPQLKKYKKTIKIAADSSLKLLAENKIIPEIIITDLDGDVSTFEKMAKTESIFVVHAHGDNLKRLAQVKKFKNCIGTTQTKPVGQINNFGGFTDGDRGVFLASHYKASRIILFGMDFGDKIGKFSNTRPQDKETKKAKLAVGESLLEWLAGFSKSELFTTSRQIKGFKKISYKKLKEMIT